ncbi:sensor histidine kinase [Nocardioides albidus]|uniref:sensor histidine kinase n=1 Tax=Nocardioides albidus TaxID=1517589 RepID=UPI0013052D85|nr:sensor histidine kinase [Nocardioides albidus]
MIVIQAQGAQRAIDTTPEQARAALRSIESTGRTGLEEMRRLLGLLAEDPGQEAVTTTRSQPTLAEVPDLVSRVRDAGLPVDLRVEGDVRRLAPGLELTGFRVVQEAVTNAFKHAGAVPVAVCLRYGATALDIDVTDVGGAADQQATSGGQGLIGMRERVRLYGGTLDAGPCPGGGFAVHARLPTEVEPL